MVEQRNRYIVVMITVPSEEVGIQIGRELVQRRLAACTNILPPMRSIYTWEGKLIEEKEVILYVKTRSDLFEDELVPLVKSMHPYQVPEIVALPILIGTEDYLGWIEEETKDQG